MEVETIKTLVEIFDVCQVENVIAGLKLKPQEIVFIGFSDVMTEGKVKDIEDFFIKKGINLKIHLEYVEKEDDFDIILDRFNCIIDSYPGCFFDLTGGDEELLAAMGIVAAKRNAPMFQFDVESGEFKDISGCEGMLVSTSAFMTIREAIELNGCIVLENEEGDVNWDFTDEFRNDIDTIWKTASVHSGSWNKQANEFERLETLRASDGSIPVDENTYLNKRIMYFLLNNRLIFGYPPRNNTFNLKYKNSQIKKVLLKAGNALELYAYNTLRKIAEEEKGYYDDIDLSVYIDWDGNVHGKNDKEKDTKNEVDIMVMRDLIPIFISCKNGEVKKEALYELDTVAKKFGGKYAKKYLFTTYISSDADSKAYLLQRAKDMNITVIQDINEMTIKKLKDEFKLLVK